MKIGDEVFVRGKVDEIRKDVVIIHNDVGYFGTDIPDVFEYGRITTTGRWIEDAAHRFICDKCGKKSSYKSNYCPDCGVLMVN